MRICRCGLRLAMQEADFGYDDGAEGCMARLLQWINGRSHELSRDYLAIPIEHLPKLIAMVDKSRPQLDTRALRWGLKDPAITRPYTHLRYW